ncbi:MAG: bifunctional folylpolyglutamate synthase/dihydrofolate synthase [Campylobacterales bacterium]|nr:bifunctional folylpolyglutamate synthase/dihydrofolate synthase [Campylobacterales bacterium]
MADFLEQKPLYYSEIDYTRMPRAYAFIKDKLTIPPLIHLVGTNGKGTTGRFIAQALFASGYSVGHYTSPHIRLFNERIWLNGSYVNDEQLEKAHKKLFALLTEEFRASLSYFEYTTLLAMIIFQGCDYVVLEAGLGGEHDATNVFEKTLSVITPIGIDHEDFLGQSIREIAGTKLRSVTNRAILGEQRFKEVYEVAAELQKDSELRFIDYKECLGEADIRLAEEISTQKELPHYLQENLLLAMAAFKKLGFKVKKKLFESQRLEGRMQRIKKNVWLDVGHNTLAAEAISHCFFPKSMNLVYNSYRDKEYRSILHLLAPIVKKVEIMPVENERMVAREELVSAIVDNGLKCSVFEGINEDENYLVFGSFSVAEAFVKFLDRLSTP